VEETSSNEEASGVKVPMPTCASEAMLIIKGSSLIQLLYVYLDYEHR
jgi:hypothetical protein